MPREQQSNTHPFEEMDFVGLLEEGADRASALEILLEGRTKRFNRDFRHLACLPHGIMDTRDYAYWIIIAIIVSISSSLLIFRALRGLVLIDGGDREN